MEETAALAGTIQRVVFQNEENGYTVLRLQSTDEEPVTVVGCVPGAAPGENLLIRGVWEQHPRHGRQMRAVEVERSLPHSREELFTFLASGVCKGIGPAIAKQIVDRYGEKSLEILESDGAEKKLYNIRGLSGQKAHEIVRTFRQTMGLRRLMEFLARYRLAPILAVRLREQYGDGALEALCNNPYLLSDESGGGAPFHVADAIAMDLGFSPDSPVRTQAAVIFELVYNERNGHVFLPADKLIHATAHMLQCDLFPAEQALDALTSDGTIVRETVADVDACYLKRLYDAEISAQIRLNALLSCAADQSRQAERMIGEIEQEQRVTYAPLQREAVCLAAREGVIILTGGPGTGKTTTVRGIAALFRRMGLSVALCAPTGRAAQRLSEVTGMDAQTIHRLLGMAWDENAGQVSFTKSEQDPLSADAVIVDESSMVDLALFSALLRALRPGTRLVLVGDADQLPSVGAGNVFSDLIRSGRVQTVFLREIFRQAEKSAIIRNAHAVNLGLPPRLDNDQGDFFFLSRRDAVRAAGTIAGLCKTRLPENMGIPAAQIQVLTPTRKGPCGTDELNRLLQAALNPPSRDRREIRRGEFLFREGDRIMQNRNNYNIEWTRQDGSKGTGIFNGDIGHVLEIDPAGQWLMLEFDGRAAAYSPDMLSEVELAYAVTVHKAQGSEYRCVVLAALPAARGLMVRGVLYTALTRARELLIIVGDDVVIRNMAANDRQQRRYSGLRWRLAHSAPDSAHISPGPANNFPGVADDPPGMPETYPTGTDAAAD